MIVRALTFVLTTILSLGIGVSIAWAMQVWEHKER